MSKSEQGKFVKVAKVLKPHGIKGAVKISFLPGASIDIDQIDKVNFLIGEQFVEYKIIQVKGTEYHPILKFKNIINIDDAKFLQTREFYVERSILRKLGIKLPIELIGAMVYLLHENELKEIGTVENIIENPNYEILELKTKSGNELMVPFIDEFITVVNYEKLELRASNKTGIFNDEL